MDTKQNLDQLTLTAFSDWDNIARKLMQKKYQGEEKDLPLFPISQEEDHDLHD